jgi:predicted HTH transcriptional regulator
MSLFLKQLKDIDFDTVRSFYETYSEGIRVEYKRDLSSNIPKVVSSFANTQGGILMIGIEEDRKTRSRKLLPLSQMAGYEEQVTQACLMGINPSILPAIRVFDVPGVASKVIVVVKVNQSVEAPHAIENSTRVYIRTGNCRSHIS